MCEHDTAHHYLATSVDFGGKAMSQVGVYDWFERPSERGRIVAIAERDPVRYEIRFGNRRAEVAKDALKAAD
jgi:DNA relaxase NicK